jgi:nitroreductase|tara:strand:+ start:1139 stop:1693 length:555 start_codon:yes stop_codon:yes gene_type:complete
MDLDKAIKSRRSARKFRDMKPDWRDIIECIDVMRHTPMAGNSFSLKFILVDDKEKIDKISKCSQQQFIANTYYVLVIYSEPSRTLNSFGERGKIYARQQAGAAIQNFLLKIEKEKLSTCWIGHFVEEEIKDLLKIPKKAEVEALFPIGYACDEKKKARRINLDSVLRFNDSKNKKMKNPKDLDV